ncbi:MAG: hypothetical protein KatS3mg119_1202 [Rhodothalassiaceae bacterium]|nr:MAG: hypothetical protein KatS3mg119_1202 [Rhodothalassiaceae bacterium]
MTKAETKAETTRGRIARRVLRILLWAAALAALAVFALVVRLSVAPWEPPAAVTARLVARIAPDQDSWRASVAALKLRLDPLAGSLRLALEDLEVRERRGRFLLTVPACELELAFWPLINGRIRPRAVATERVDLVWHWSAARLGERIGEVLLAGVNEEAAGLGGTMARITETVAALAALDDEGAAFAGVDRLSLPLVDLTLVEDERGLIWHLPQARLVYAATRSERTLTIAGAIPAGNGPFSALEIDSIAAADGSRRLRFALEGLRPDRLADAVPSLAALAGVAMPVDLDASVALAADRRLADARLRASFAAGTFQLDPFYPEAVPVDGLAFTAVLDAGRDVLRLEDFRLGLNGAGLVLSGALTLPAAGRPPVLTLRGGFEALSIADLVRYWPDGPARGARRWIADHIARGTVRDAELAFRLPGEAFETGELPADAFTLAFGFADLEVHYLGALPPLERAAGRGRLTLERLVLDLEQGRIGAQDAAGSRVVLEEIGRPHAARAEIALKLAGPLPDLLATLDEEPLGFPSRFGLDPARVAGGASARAALTIPLVKTVTLADVGFAVTGRVEDFRLAPFGVLGIAALDSPALDVTVDGNGMRVSGPVAAPGVTARLDWHEDFKPAAGAPSSLFRLADGRLDFAEATWLDPDPLGLSGDAGWEGTIRGRGFAVDDGAFSFDLGPAAIDLAWFGYAKPAGRPARLALRIGARAGGGRSGWALSDLRYESGSDRIAGGMRWHERDGAIVIDALTLDPLRLGETALAVTLAREKDRPVLTVTGARLDARAALTQFASGRLPGNGEGTAFDLAARIDEVLARNGVTFAALAAKGAFGTRGLAALDLTLGDDHGHPLAGSLSFDTECGCRRLFISAEDAGRFALGLGLFENAEGGRLTVRATVSPAAQRRLEMEGLARIENVTIVKRSALVAAVEKGKESGLDAYVGEKGLAFDLVEIPFRVDGPIIDIDNGRARGDRLGLTFAGQVDRENGRLAINGLMVPAYALNSLLGKIPIIGGLFSGGSGGGLFAVRYDLSGRIDAPEVSVSPMTLILPGILRKPFEGGKAKLPPAERRDGPQDDGR